MTTHTTVISVRPGEAGSAYSRTAITLWLSSTTLWTLRSPSGDIMRLIFPKMVAVRWLWSCLWGNSDVTRQIHSFMFSSALFRPYTDMSIYALSRLNPCSLGWDPFKNVF